MDLRKIYNKQGGNVLIKQYRKSGALGTALAEFILLGKSRTALEILRNSAQLKTKQHLESRYRNKLKQFDQDYASCSFDHNNSNTIWVCWFQGIENAPEIIRKCYDSLKKNLNKHKIILITSDNINRYAHFPSYIIDKWEAGIITNTHMTDLLRLELLTTYGGTWIDATVLCTEDEKYIPSYFFDSDLFFYQCLKPGRDGQSTYMSTWFISAKSHNKVLEATKSLCYEYWKKNDELIDYYLLHDFMSIVLEYYPEDWDKIVPRDNATPHELLLRMFNTYDDCMWKAIRAQSPFHKLSYKFSNEQAKLKGTYFDIIITSNNYLEPNVDTDRS